MLEVSDKNISTDSIDAYPVEDRFLKLPIENFLDIMQFEPLAPQYAFINAVNKPGTRFVTACLSRRTGKTYIANIVAFTKLLEPETRVLLVSANYTLAVISWNILRGLIRRFNIETTKSNEKDRSIILANGSQITMGSVSQIDSLVGVSNDLILFDECALSDPHKTRDGFQVALMPTLDKIDSKAVFISTPRGMDPSPFYTWYQRGYDEEFPEWSSIRSDYRENPRLLQTTVDTAKKSMSKQAFKQEYEASFESSNEGVVYDFSFDVDVLSAEELKPILEMKDRCDKIIGIDIGFKDATTAVVLYVLEGVFYVVAEYSASQKDSKTQAEGIRKLVEEHDVDFSFGDSAAAQVLYDWAYLYDVSINKAVKHKLPGIAYVATKVENHELKISSECKDLLHCIRNYSWKTDSASGKQDTLHAFSDIMDALRYAMYSYAPNLN